VLKVPSNEESCLFNAESSNGPSVDSAAVEISRIDCIKTTPNSSGIFKVNNAYAHYPHLLLQRNEPRIVWSSQHDCVFNVILLLGAETHKALVRPQAFKDIPE
jgi:hypothetical protein